MVKKPEVLNLKQDPENLKNPDSPASVPDQLLKKALVTKPSATSDNARPVVCAGQAGHEVSILSDHAVLSGRLLLHVQLFISSSNG